MVAEGCGSCALPNLPAGTCCQSCWEAEGTVLPCPTRHISWQMSFGRRGEAFPSSLFLRDCTAIAVIAGSEWEWAEAVLAICCIFKAIINNCTEFPRHVVDSLPVGILKSSFLTLQRVVMSWCRQKGCAWCGDLLLTCALWRMIRTSKLVIKWPGALCYLISDSFHGHHSLLTPIFTLPSN